MSGSGETTVNFLTVVDDSGMYGSCFCQGCGYAEQDGDRILEGEKCPGCGHVIASVERLGPNDCWYPFGGSDF